MAAPAYKRPESVLVVVHSRAGEVLLLRRRQPDDFWQSVTGSLAWGEEAAAAARRELAEETGLVDVVVRDLQVRRRFPILPAWRARYAPEAETNLEYWFAVELAQAQAVRLDGREHLEYRWLAWRAAMELASSSTNREAIAAVLGAGRDGLT